MNILRRQTIYCTLTLTTIQNIIEVNMRKTFIGLTALSILMLILMQITGCASTTTGETNQAATETPASPALSSSETGTSIPASTSLTLEEAKQQSRR